VSITADAIGDTSNVASGSEFVVASFGKDSYVAKNDNALKGGTSEEVRVVGKDDQKTLKAELVEEMLQKIKDTSASSDNPGRGVYLITDSAKTEDPKFSAQTGEVAKSLTLTMTLKATLLRYNTEDVTTLANSAIDQSVPSGYVRANIPSKVELSASTVSDDATTVKGLAKVQVSLLPLMDKAQIIAAIKGKNPSSLENVLRALVPGYQSAEINITPKRLPPALKLIPKNPSNISLQLSPAT
jgi:hypothetical protein